MLQSGRKEALIELWTSFDGYELLRSNDEVEETASSQFISDPSRQNSKITDAQKKSWLNRTNSFVLYAAVAAYSKTA